MDNTMKVTYWKELRTGCIYKYYGESKPHNVETAWVESTAWEYEHQFADALYCFNK